MSVKLFLTNYIIGRSFDNFVAETAKIDIDPMRCPLCRQTVYIYNMGITVQSFLLKLTIFVVKLFSSTPGTSAHLYCFRINGLCYGNYIVNNMYTPKYIISIIIVEACTVPTFIKWQIFNWTPWTITKHPLKSTYDNNVRTHMLV